MEMDDYDDFLSGTPNKDDVVSLVASLEKQQLDPDTFLDLTSSAAQLGLSHQLQTLIINTENFIPTDDAGIITMLLNVHKAGITFTRVMLEKYPSLVKTVDHNIRGVLHYAVAACDLELCQLLNEYGADPNLEDVEDMTPLHYAIKHNTDKPFDSIRDVIIYLKSIGTNLETICIHMNTALGEAVEDNNIALMDLLISLGANTDTVSGYNDTLLSKACRACNIHTCRHIVEYLKTHDLLSDQINKKNQVSATPLCYALCKKSVEVTRLLLENGVNFENVSRSFHHSPLHYAMAERHIELVKLLTGYGADVNGPLDRRGSITIMHRPTIYRAVKTLGDSCTALDEAVEIFTHLLQHGVCVTEQNSWGENIITVFLNCVRECFQCRIKCHMKVEWLLMLIEKGANVRFIDKAFNNAFFGLHKSILPESMSFGLVLREHGVNINQMNVSGNTPLVDAVKRGNQDMVFTLIMLNADVNVGKPMVHAASSANLLVMRMLYLAGCRMRGVDGWMDRQAVTIDRIPDIVVPNHRELTDWIVQRTSHPSPLTLMCRRVIRDTMDDFNGTKIDSIPLPQTLKEFFNFDDVRDLVKHGTLHLLHLEF